MRLREWRFWLSGSSSNRCGDVAVACTRPYNGGYRKYRWRSRNLDLRVKDEDFEFMEKTVQAVLGADGQAASDD